MMQAMEFNSAWSQNMTEFERQAREIEETAIRRHQEEFDAFRQKMYNKEARSYKFSRELLNLKASVEANAKREIMKRRTRTSGRRTSWRSGSG